MLTNARLAYVTLLLSFALGCHRSPEATDASAEGGTNAKLGAKSIAATTNDPKQPSGLTNVVTVDNITTNDVTLISVWHSPTSTAQERVAVVNEFLSHETSIESAMALLGKDGVLSHHFGLYVSPTNNTRAGVSSQEDDYDFWLLEYEDPRGLVTLRFSRTPINKRQFHFEIAYTTK